MQEMQDAKRTSRSQIRGWVTSLEANARPVGPKAGAFLLASEATEDARESTSVRSLIVGHRAPSEELGAFPVSMDTQRGERKECDGSAVGKRYARREHWGIAANKHLLS
jgi:hypothetical protein